MGSGRASGNTPSTAIVNSRLNRPFSLMRVEVNRTRLPSGVHPVTKSAPGWYVRRRGTPPVTGTM